jgi:hypothetical protein
VYYEPRRAIDVSFPPYASTYSRDARQFEEDQAITDTRRQELKWPPIVGPADAIAPAGPKTGVHFTLNKSLRQFFKFCSLKVISPSAPVISDMQESEEKSLRESLADEVCPFRLWKCCGKTSGRSSVQMICCRDTGERKCRY